jgi:hypothetical protein
VQPDAHSVLAIFAGRAGLAIFAGPALMIVPVQGSLLEQLPESLSKASPTELCHMP